MVIKLYVRKIWRTILQARQRFYSFFSNIKYKKNPLNIQVATIEETLDFIIENNTSVVRFGDGELDLIAGNNIPFQNYDERLSESLIKIAASDSTKNLVICIPDIFSNLEQYIPASANSWSIHRQKRYEIYKSYFSSSYYGNAFISRPYYMFKDKYTVENRFNRLKNIWNNKDLLIIEGITTRSGVGNDLFANAKTIQRIICPSKNAFAKYDEIFKAATQYGENKIILIMLGPTAKYLAVNLAKEDFQAIDIGHIDTEYEWFKMGAKEKVKLKNKHTAEHNYDKNIDFIYDENYEKEIIVNIS